MIRDQIADQLVYSTVRISCHSATGSSVGTGFFMSYPIAEDKEYIALVTNKHVVDGYDYGEITIVKENEDGTPNDTEHIVVSISDLQKHCIPHPESNIDICFILVMPEINKLIRDRNKPYIRCISSKMTLTEEDISSLTAIEDIIMIGYPSGIIDSYNNKPIVRKGITATNLRLDYNGTPDFMIDAACFRGSSGSPVFLRKEGLVKEITDQALTLGLAPSYSLLGILHSMSVHNKIGEIVVKDIPTTLKPVVEMETPLNLGYVTKSRKITELFELLVLSIKA